MRAEGVLEPPEGEERSLASTVMVASDCKHRKMGQQMIPEQCLTFTPWAGCPKSNSGRRAGRAWVTQRCSLVTALLHRALTSPLRPTCCTPVTVTLPQVPGGSTELGLLLSAAARESAALVLPLPTRN